MRRYMPRPHVSFIQRLEALTPSVRAVVLEQEAAEAEGSAAAVVEAYDTALEARARFRYSHFEYFPPLCVHVDADRRP